MLALRRPIGPDQRAKRFLSLAVDQARARGSEVVAPEHMVLAIAASGGTAGEVLERHAASAASIHESLDADEARALRALGISLEEVRERLEEAFGPNAMRAPPRGRRCAGWSSEAQAALDAALDVARELGDRRVTPEHLLVALIRQRRRAARLLETLGVRPDDLERELLPAAPAARWSP